MLIVTRWWDEDYKAKAVAEYKAGKLPHELDKPKTGEGEAIHAAWSERDLGITVGKKHIKALEAIYTACCEGHGFIGTSRQLPVFDNGGIVLADARNIPVEHITKMEEADREINRRHAASRATGIVERLDAHNAALRAAKVPGQYDRGGRWNEAFSILPDGTERFRDQYDPYCNGYCLDPRWNATTDEKGVVHKHSDTTKHDVVYFLNPMNQQQNYWGWVTVEDLDDWIQGKGKIPGFGRAREHILRCWAVRDGKLDSLYSDEIFCKDCVEIFNKRDNGHAVRTSTCPKCAGPNVIIKKEEYASW
jgi:hypothetical protein